MTRVIAIDGLGGDHAPDIVVEGLRLNAERNPDISYIITGPIERMKAAFGSLKIDGDRISYVDAPDHVAMNAKPSQAVRQGRNSSLWKAIEEVKEGRAHAIVSGGNTGALMAMSALQLRTIEGVDRPAIAAIWPTLRSESVVLDVGANLEADANQLTQFALMGVEFARLGLGVRKPTIGLLNIGSEDQKGREEIREAQDLLQAMDDTSFAYHGFVEGNDIGKGTVDVVVTDGFTGNIALKSAEGTAKQVGDYLRAALSRSIGGRIGYFLAKGALVAFKRRVDPRRVNGGPLLGLNGLVVKSHGGTDGVGFASALDLAVDLAKAGIIDKLHQRVSIMHQKATESSQVVSA